VREWLLLLRFPPIYLESFPFSLVPILIVSNNYISSTWKPIRVYTVSCIQNRNYQVTLADHYTLPFFIIIIYQYLSVNSVPCSSVAACCYAKKTGVLHTYNIQSLAPSLLVFRRLLKTELCRRIVFLTTNYMFRFLLMSELWHCLMLLGVLEVFWFYATLIIFVDNNNNNNLIPMPLFSFSLAAQKQLIWELPLPCTPYM